MFGVIDLKWFNSEAVQKVVISHLMRDLHPLKWAGDTGSGFDMTKWIALLQSHDLFGQPHKIISPPFPEGIPMGEGESERSELGDDYLSFKFKPCVDSEAQKIIPHCPPPAGGGTGAYLHIREGFNVTITMKFGEIMGLKSPLVVITVCFRKLCQR